MSESNSSSLQTNRINEERQIMMWMEQDKYLDRNEDHLEGRLRTMVIVNPIEALHVQTDPFNDHAKKEKGLLVN